MRIVTWGTYDLGKPRVRIMLQGLRAAGIEVVECHVDLWSGVEDKSQIKGKWSKLKFVLRWLAAYPALVFRYLRTGRHDAVLVPYLGQLDVLVLWLFAKLRGKPIVWDAFLSLYNTVVEDRKLVGRHNPVAYLVYAWEWLACRAAAQVVLDTAAHGRYFVERFHLNPARVQRVFVGVEPLAFPAASDAQRDVSRDSDNTLVLFYGQFIPLHGIETIIRAARLMRDEAVSWVLIGSGQQEGYIRQMLEEQPLEKVEWIPWVQYEELVHWIHRADVCLGIFGASQKTAMVIPNKAYQVLSAQRPLITADTPAIRELISPDPPCIYLVPPDQPEALCDAVRSFRSWQPASDDEPCGPRLQAIKERFSIAAIGADLEAILRSALTKAKDVR